MTSPSFTSRFSLAFMAFLCTMLVTGVPTAVEDRPSRQMFPTPQYDYPIYTPLYFYNPYDVMFMKPAEVNLEDNPTLHYITSPSSAGYLDTTDGIPRTRANILILPSADKCLLATVPADGNCIVKSSERSGFIDIRLIVEAQAAKVEIQARSPTMRIRLICSEIVGASVETQTGRITAPSDTPRIELGLMILEVESTGDNARVRCKWNW